MLSVAAASNNMIEKKLRLNLKIWSNRSLPVPGRLIPPDVNFFDELIWVSKPAKDND